MRSDSVLSPLPDPPSSALLAAPVPADCDAEACERQVRRILDHPIFSGSRRLSEFVTFSARAAMEGRTEIDQYEVAEQVLHRDQDFNPLDDASVRKVASQVRAKLEEYFQDEGQADPVVVSLPRRSYVLRFRRRAGTQLPAAEGADGPTELPSEDVVPRVPQPALADQEEPSTLQPRGTSELENEPVKQVTAATTPFLPDVAPPHRSGAKAWWMVVYGVVAMLAGAWILHGVSDSRVAPPAVASTNAPLAPGEFHIVTQSGDLRGRGGEFQSGAVLVGPRLDVDGDATVRMRFLPEAAAQHGGLMLFADIDNYVRFGSHFKVRSMLEFGHETLGEYSMEKSDYRFDPLAQRGLPLWLSIRKQGGKFSAYSSRDGHHWDPFGSDQVPAPPMMNTTLGLYAVNGLTNNAEIEARFRDLGVGLRFHHRPEGATGLSQFPGWKLGGGCADGSLLTVRNGALEFRFPEDRLCISVLERLWNPARGEDWYVQAHLDFQAINGNAAGIRIQGERGTVRLVRRDLNGASIMLERDLDRDVRMPDFPGAPPIFLRLTARDGYITGSFSRDGEQFETIPARISLEELGPLRGYGVETTLSHWLQKGVRPPARLYAIEQGLLRLKPLDPLTAVEQTKAIPPPLTGGVR